MQSLASRFPDSPTLAKADLDPAHCEVQQVHSFSSSPTLQVMCLFQRSGLSLMLVRASAYSFGWFHFPFFSFRSRKTSTLCQSPALTMTTVFLVCLMCTNQASQLAVVDSASFYASSVSHVHRQFMFKFSNSP